MSDPFYVPLAPGLFASTDHTRGPWGAESQHGGPPASLLGRAIEAVTDRPGMEVARITFEILKPIPVRDLRVRAEMVRPGRSVELIEGVILDGDNEVMRARAWRIRTTRLELKGPPPSRLLGPAEASPTEPLPTAYEGYLHAMEMRSLRGAFTQQGPGTTWFRMRHPLLPDEPVSPLTRVLIAADSASGISSVLDWHEWLYINTDLTVQLHRPAVGEWVCLDAETTVQPSGIGLAASEVHDERGPIGRTSQSLYIARRAE